MACASKNISRLEIGRLLGLMRTKKYIVYTQPYKLNIVGIRRANTNPIRFDDALYVFWKTDNNKWAGKEYVITTDPSTKYLEQGGIGSYEGQKATAILPHGQYVDKWVIKKHNGSYDALGQDKELCVYRDYDRNSTLTFDVGSKDCGKFGINIHHAKSGGADDGQGNTAYIGAYSAGCQVFQNYYCFLEFMDMAKKQRELYGNPFTYTLFDLSLRRKYLIKRAAYSAIVVASASLIIYGASLVSKSK
tara:strand:- start:476 stop:1216 length:741 start_codon:yes stop_codon:yes gene_type:complete